MQPQHSNPESQDGDKSTARARILEAAFGAFVKNGYAAASMLAIATQAQVSKRDLYALVGNKQAMLEACIRERAKRLQVPADLPMPVDRDELAQVLIAFGSQLIREISDPTVIAVFRLAIAEAIQAPEVATVLDAFGREASRAALRKIMVAAQTSGLLKGRNEQLAEEFFALLFGDLMMNLLLRVAQRPTAREMTARARRAVERFLVLNQSCSVVPMVCGMRNTSDRRY
jgi:AcrR family transcriptional regulator